MSRPAAVRATPSVPATSVEVHAAARRRHSRWPRAWRYVTVVLAALLAAGMAQAQVPPPTPQALLEQHSCLFCHADHDARTGPSFADIAKAYRGNKEAATTLAAALRKGTHGGGPWHMPPHPEISADDAATMVHYILSVRD